MTITSNLKARGWRKDVLGRYIELSNGKGITSKQMGPNKPFPVYGSSSILDYCDQPLIFSDTIVIGRVGACGTVQIAKAPCWVSDNAMYVSNMRREIEFGFLYYLLNYLQLGRFASRTNQPSLPQGPILEHQFLLPPYPVQERIVEILKKADEIRRKRREALELADKILPALFLEMFGDPAMNPKGWPVEPLGELVYFDTTQVKPVQGEIYMYLAPEDIESGTGNFSGPHPKDGRELGSAKYRFTNEHVLYCKLRPYLNKVVLPLSAGICSTELVPIRPRREKLLREFLAIYLRMPFFVSIATQKSQGTKMPRFGVELMKREPMMVPPLNLQEVFCRQVAHLIEEVQKLKDSMNEANAVFQSLLSRAFTGELTAEWEATNAEWIEQRTAFYKRLPRLVILALLVEKAKRMGHIRAEVLITALMKYLFLLQMEGSSRQRLYHFIPYYYGPFAKEVYADLQGLVEEGFVVVDNETEEEKTRIILKDPEEIEQEIAELPDELKQDIATIIESYGELDHRSLLQKVYDKYPEYAKKSRLRNRKK